MVAAIETSRRAAAACGVRHLDLDRRGSELCDHITTSDGEVELPLLALLNFWRPLALSTGNVLYRRTLLEAVGPWREDWRSGEDYEYNLRAAARIPSLAVLAATLVDKHHGRADQLRHEVRLPLLLHQLAELLETLESHRDRPEARHPVLHPDYLEPRLEAALGWSWAWIAVQASLAGETALARSGAAAWLRLARRGVPAPGVPKSLRWLRRLHVLPAHFLIALVAVRAARRRAKAHAVRARFGVPEA
jgi:hypothetical protein